MLQWRGPLFIREKHVIIHVCVFIFFRFPCLPFERSQRTPSGLHHPITDRLRWAIVLCLVQFFLTMTTRTQNEELFPFPVLCQTLWSLSPAVSCLSFWLVVSSTVIKQRSLDICKTLLKPCERMLLHIMGLWKHVKTSSTWPNVSYRCKIFQNQVSTLID